MCQFDGCLGIARVLVKRTSLDAHIQVGGLTRTRFAQSIATEPAQEDVRVCVCDGGRRLVIREYVLASSRGSSSTIYMG